MARDTDFAAVAIKTALLDKYSKSNAMEDLELTANERTISIRHGGRAVEGTRDDLLAAIRKSETYDDFWKAFPRVRAK